MFTQDDSDGLVLKLGLCPCLSDPGLYDLDNVYSLRVMVYATLAAERFPMHRGKWVEVPDAAHVHEGYITQLHY